MTITADQLRFSLLPSANPPADLVYLHNNIYRLWKSVWTETFAKIGIPAGRLDGEFGRQDLVACLSVGDKPLAVHLYSFYTIDSLACREHPYLRDNYPELFFVKLQNAGVRGVMSWEYMTVHPDFRKAQGQQLPVGLLLGGQAIESLRYFGADAAIAPARRDHKINELGYTFGAEAVIENVMNHNIACDLIMTRPQNIKIYPDAGIQAEIYRIWEARTYVPSVRPNEENNVIQFPAAKRAA